MTTGEVATLISSGSAIAAIGMLIFNILKAGKDDKKELDAAKTKKSEASIDGWAKLMALHMEQYQLIVDDNRRLHERLDEAERREEECRQALILQEKRTRCLEKALKNAAIPIPEDTV